MRSAAACFISLDLERFVQCLNKIDCVKRSSKYFGDLLVAAVRTCNSDVLQVVLAKLSPSSSAVGQHVQGFRMAAAILCATELNNVEMLRSLLAHPISATAIESTRYLQAVQYALEHGQSDLAKPMIDYFTKSKNETKVPLLDKCLRAAVQGGSLEMVRAILDHSEPSWTPQVFERALEEAAMANCVGILEEVLDNAPPLPLVRYVNAVYWAGHRGSTDVMAVLLARVVKRHLGLAVDAVAGASYHSARAVKQVLHHFGDFRELDSTGPGLQLLECALDRLLSEQNETTKEPMECHDGFLALQRSTPRLPAAAFWSAVDRQNEQPEGTTELRQELADLIRRSDVRDSETYVLNRVRSAVVNNRSGHVLLLQAFAPIDFERFAALSRSTAIFQVMLDNGWNMKSKSLGVSITRTRPYQPTWTPSSLFEGRNGLSSDIALIRWLLQRGASPCEPDGSSRALDAAMGRASVDVLDLLVEHGSDAASIRIVHAAATRNSRAALEVMDWALSHHYVDVEHIIYKPLMVNSRAMRYDRDRAIAEGPPLHRAARYGRSETCDLLLRHGADLHSLGGPPNERCTVLQLVEGLEKPSMVKFFKRAFKDDAAAKAKKQQGEVSNKNLPHALWAAPASINEVLSTNDQVMAQP